MSRKTDIENALLSLDGGAFQKLAESYVYRKLGLSSLTALGSHKGTNKVAKGIPDAHSFVNGGVYLIGFTTSKSASFKKLAKDICDCLNLVNDEEHPIGNVAKIVCCHSCWRLKLWQEEALRNKAPGLVELLGPSTIVEDLCFDFADLAFEYLGISVGTGALTTVPAFIEAEENRLYTTPHSFELRGREEDLEKLLKLVELNRSIVVTGAAGLGKTRLALEAVELYGQKNHCEAFVIDSHACADVASDARLFLKNTNAIVLVDDADQLVDLKPLLNVALLNSQLKVVVTVRDYALATVSKAMRGFAEFSQYVVPLLSEETIISILKEDLGIVNPLYIGQICSVAKGNLRLAIMAGIQAVQNGFPAIRNAYDILELFFSGLEESLTDCDIFALEQYSLYGVSNLIPGSPAFDSIVRSGRTERQIISDARRMSRMAILDMLENNDGQYAVRFEQQNLRDYCIYRALVYDSIVSIEDYIRSTIGVEPGALSTALNVLLRIFASEETTELVKEGAKSYWLSLDSRDDVKQTEAMCMLHPLLEPYDLEYAQAAIRSMKPGEMIAGEEYQRATVGPASLPMQIVCRTKGEPRWSSGMELLLKLLVGGGDAIASYKVAFENLLPPDEVSIALGYEHEKALLNRLMGMMRSGSEHRGNTAISLLRLCEAYLLTNFSIIVSSDAPNTFKIKRWQLPNSEQLGKLRRLAIEGLVLLSDDSVVGEEARGCLYDRLSSSNRDDSVLRNDIEALAQCLRGGCGSLAGEDRLLYAMRESCERLDMCYEDLFDVAPSPYYALAHSTVGQWHTNRLEGDCYAFEGVGKSELTSLLDYCQSRHAISQFEDYDLRQAINEAMLSSVGLYGPDYAAERFDDLCRGGGWQFLFSYTVLKTVEECGYERVRRVATRYDLPSLVAMVDGFIPDSSVNDITVASILESQADSDCTLTGEAVAHLETVKPGFAQRYWKAKEPKLLDDLSSAELFLNRVATSDEPTLLLEQMVGKDIASLRQIYLSLADRPNFDSDDLILSYLYTRDETIIEDLVSLAVESEAAYRDEAVKRLGYLGSPSGGSFRALAGAVDRLAEGSSPWSIMALLSPHNEHLQEGFPICDFISYYIETKKYAPDGVANVSIVIEELPAGARFKILSKILSATSDQEVLEELQLMPMSFSGFGSEGFVPQYLEEIDTLKKLSETLPNTAEYLPHRVRIEKVIEALKRDMGKERWRAFHGRF